uniref:Pre-mRNA-processing factor 39-like isoform X1 n=1 Tax=Rhizophora mucronata TaxID=61149 RepID=A0A2P2MLT9_RHIMU
MSPLDNSIRICTICIYISYSRSRGHSTTCLCCNSRSSNISSIRHVQTSITRNHGSVTR